MFSSNATESRRRSQKTPSARRLTRKNSSFLASVKSFVAAPLSRLFSGTDEFDDAKDEMGKRRRLEGAQNEPAAAVMEDGPAPSKKMRRTSPEHRPPPRQSAYLDPSQSAFGSQPVPQMDPQYARLFNTQIQQSTIDIPRNEPRTTLSPLRNHLSRTMSIDPPHSSAISRPLARDVSLRNMSSHTPRDQSMEPAPGSSLIRPSSISVARDTPIPRAGSSFRMRTSLTPQPTRDFSEPPTISSLSIKPSFVRAPPVAEPVRPVPNLGTLVENTRRTQSPIRQSSTSSLLFGTRFQHDSRPLTAAERALRDLDAFKTPLQPTRVRESRSQATFGADVTDMFNRKKSYQRMPGARGEDAKVNKTKPYAGQAGIKKHLSRSRLALTEQNQAQGKANIEPCVEGDSIVQKRKEHTPEPLKGLKLPDGPADTFRPVEKRPSIPSQSSLRVGRTFTSRQHIERPARRAGVSKFSASFDDDDDDRDSEEAQKERAMMEEAAKKVPVFNLPSSFSFAKESASPSIQEDLSEVKEPPTTSLPFSFSAPSAPPKATEPPLIVPAPSPSIPATSHTVPEAPSPAPADSSKSGSVPNFFANSKLASQPAPGPTRPLIFGEQAVVESAVKSTFTFGPTAATSSSLFDQKNEGSVPTIAATTTYVAAADKPAPSSSFGVPSAASSIFGSNNGLESSKGFSFGKPAVISASETGPQPTEENARNAGAAPEPVKPAPSLFGAPATSLASASTTTSGSTFSFGQPTPTTESSKSDAFTFGAGKVDAISSSMFQFGTPKSPALPVEQTVPAPVSVPEQPKPTFSFGTTAPTNSMPQSLVANKLAQPSSVPSKSFTFDTPASGSTRDGAPKSPFLFGNANGSNAGPSFGGFGSVTPSTPTASDTEKKGGFGSSTSTPTPSSPVPSFSFNAPSGASKPFSGFGSSAPAPARPLTPPNQDTDLKMDESPTREMTFGEAPRIAEPRPTLGSNGGFPSTFGGSTTTSGFGSQSTSATTPTFSFGGPSASNLFVKAIDKPEENKGGFGGFGQTNGSTSTGFGQISGSGFGSANGSSSGFPFSSRKDEPPRPATAGSFPFSSPTSATATSTAFSFGGPSNNSGGGTTFPSAPLSAPNSPSTFNNTPSPSFAFGALPPTNPFAANSGGFGSQPASPAPGTNALPSSGFGSDSSVAFGAAAPAANVHPFGGPAPTSSSGGGGGMFTIGAAPTAATSGPRQFKKLPTRRGAKR